MSEPLTSPVRQGGRLLLCVCIFTGALLLFMVEPLVARTLLPWFGGSAAVWTTCLLFFQVMLLAGYAYAHATTRWLSLKAQRWVHLGLITAAVLSLPVWPPEWLKPTSPEQPIARVLVVLLVTVGLPFFLLASTGTLVQTWWARTNPGMTPYRLYALSNFGSLAGLLAYPFVLEPLVRLRAQSFGWSTALVGFGVLCAICTVIGTRGEIHVVQRDGDGSRPRAIRWLAWIVWPACGSLLLVSISAALTQNIAPVPFLWVLPLALYLVTFIISFEHSRWYRRALWMPLFGVAAMTVAWVLIMGQHRSGLWTLLGVFGATLFAGCMVCHGELYRLRPSPRYLTGFYLALSLGGAIGGACAAVLAPLLLSGIWELHIALGVCAVLCLIVLWADAGSRLRYGRPALAWIGLIAFTTTLIGILAADTGPRVANGKLLHRSRNFYGMLSVYDVEKGSQRYRLLEHGGITHGIERHSDRRPAGYYLPESGVGRVLRAAGREKGLRVGVTGLGAGALAAWTRAEDTYRFYEIDPQVVDVAREYFGYLPQSPSAVDVIVGDARMAMEQERPQAYDVMILDAFSGDAVPTHLLTAEAMELYQRQLSPGGVIAVNITNRYLDLAPVLARLGEEMGWHVRVVEMRAPAEDAAAFSNRWAILSADEALFRDPLLIEVAKVPEVRRPVELWTDGYASVLPILK